MGQARDKLCDKWLDRMDQMEGTKSLENRNVHLIW